MSEAEAALCLSWGGRAYAVACEKLLEEMTTSSRVPLFAEGGTATQKGVKPPRE